MTASQKPVPRPASDPSATDRTSSPRVGRGAIRRAGLALVVLLIALVPTGCLTGDVTVKIDKSGSGVMDIELLPYDELQKRLKELNAISLAENAIEGYDGATFKSTTVDGRIAYRAHLPFDDYQDLVDVMTNGIEIAGVNLRVFSDFQLTEIDGNWRLDATPSPEMLSDALKADPSLQQLMDSEGRAALNSDLRLTISLPGRIVRTNGDRIASGTARWSLKKDLAPRITMATEPKPLLTFVQKVLVGALLAIVLGIMLNLWGSRTAWQSGRTERRERKRAKKLTFGPKQGAGRGAGWDNSGPIAPAAEGTVPDSGPMPPRSIPTLRDSTVAASTSEIVTPPISNLPPVAPPVAPAVDPSIADPFAPHRPGQATGGLDAGDSYGDMGAPIAPPVAPAVDPNRPDPFAPHVPGAAMAQPDVGAPTAWSGGQEAAAGHPIGDEPTAALFDLVDDAHDQDASNQNVQDQDVQDQREPLMFDLDEDSGVRPAIFDLVEGDDGPTDRPTRAESSSQPAPRAEQATEPAPQPAVQPVPQVEPTPLEPTPLEPQAFTFDGTPGWFSSDDDDQGGSGAGAAPAPASVPNPAETVETGGAVGVTSSTFMPDPAFRDAADGGDAGAVDGPADRPGSATGPDEGAGPSEAQHSIPAAWYPDPDDPRRYRWWDGTDWTDYVSGEDS